MTPPTDRAEIEAAAREMGIIPGDPAYGFVQTMLRLLETTERINSRAAQPISDQQLREFTHGAVRLMETMLLRRMVQVNRGMVLGAIAVAMLCLGAGFGAGWITRGGAPSLICADQRGGRLCWVWTAPPTEPEPKAMR